MLIFSYFSIKVLIAATCQCTFNEFCSGIPWQNLYANDLVIITESLEKCVRRLLTWKEAMEKKGLRVNAGKFVCVEVLFVCLC